MVWSQIHAFIKARYLNWLDNIIAGIIFAFFVLFLLIAFGGLQL